MVMPAPKPQMKISARKIGNGGSVASAIRTTAPVSTAAPINLPRSVSRRAIPASAMLATMVAAQKARFM